MVTGRWALIHDGLVTGVCIWDGETTYDPGDDILLVNVDNQPQVSEGWTYQGGEFTPPDPGE